MNALVIDSKSIASSSICMSLDSSFIHLLFACFLLLKMWTRLKETFLILNHMKQTCISLILNMNVKLLTLFCIFESMEMR